MAGDRVSLTLGNVRPAVGLVRVRPVGRVDCPLKCAGEAERVSVFDAVEHDLVPAYEVVHVHAQMRRTGMAKQFRRKPSNHIV